MNLEVFVGQYIWNPIMDNQIWKRMTINLRAILDREFPELKEIRNLTDEQLRPDSTLRKLFRSLFYQPLCSFNASSEAFEKELDFMMLKLTEELIIAYQKDLGNRYYEEEQSLREAHDDEVNEIRLQKEAGVLDYGQDDYDENEY